VEGVVAAHDRLEARRRIVSRTELPAQGLQHEGCLWVERPGAAATVFAPSRRSTASVAHCEAMESVSGDVSYDVDCFAEFKFLKVVAGDASDPDTDSIASAMGYAWLFERTRRGKHRRRPRRGAQPTTAFVLKTLGWKLPSC